MSKLTVTYIKHSGFLIETANSYLLFDYWQGKLPELQYDKELYIFSSHAHHDHYTKDIFKLENNIVESIEVLDYNHVLNEEFLDNLINNASKLDSNLRNVASYEYIDILKEEMINILNLNEVKIHYNEDIDVFIGELEYTDVKFFINKQFQFKGVIKA